MGGPTPGRIAFAVLLCAAAALAAPGQPPAASPVGPVDDARLIRKEARTGTRATPSRALGDDVADVLPAPGGDPLGGDHYTTPGDHYTIREAPTPPQAPPAPPQPPADAEVTPALPAEASQRSAFQEPQVYKKPGDVFPPMDGAPVARDANPSGSMKIEAAPKSRHHESKHSTVSQAGSDQQAGEKGVAPSSRDSSSRIKPAIPTEVHVPNVPVAPAGATAPAPVGPDTAPPRDVVPPFHENSQTPQRQAEVYQHSYASAPPETVRKPQPHTIDLDLPLAEATPTRQNTLQAPAQPAVDINNVNREERNEATLPANAAAAEPWAGRPQHGVVGQYPAAVPARDAAASQGAWVASPSGVSTWQAPVQQAVASNKLPLEERSEVVPAARNKLQASLQHAVSSSNAQHESKDEAAPAAGGNFVDPSAFGHDAARIGTDRRSEPPARGGGQQHPHPLPPPEPSIVGGGSSGRKGYEDQILNLDPTSELLVQSKLFMEFQLKIERTEWCIEKGGVMGFVVTQARTQITDAIIVSMDIMFEQTAKPQKIYNVQVVWQSQDGGPHYQAALNQLRAAMEAQGKRGIINVGAKLILPEDAACDLPSAPASATTDASGVPSFSQEHIFDETVLSFRPMGLDVAGELEFYHRLLRRQAADGSGPTCSATAKYPDSHNWRKQSPACLDYVHDQGSCGACYMFASVDSLSDRHCINAGSKSTLGVADQLSTQRPLVCMKHPDGLPCSGGTAEMAYSAIRSYKDSTAMEWEYEPACFEQPPCSFGGVCSEEPAYKARCLGFFTPNEVNVIETYFDAYDAVKKRCLPENFQCKDWARSKYFKRGSVAFFPTKEECKELEDKFLTSSWGAASPAGGILVEDDDHESDLVEDTSLDEAFRKTQANRAKIGSKLWPFDDWFGWGRRRSSEEAAGSVDSAAVGSTSKPVRTGTEMTKLCNTDKTNDRCKAGAMQAIHTLSAYYAVPPTKACFKEEIYKYGPFFAAFWVYADFTNFFAQWPLEGYSRQLGAPPAATWPNTASAAVPKGALGGHAVVLVGWEAGCTYHVCNAACMGGQLVEYGSTAEEEMRQEDGVPGVSLMEVADRTRRSMGQLGVLRDARRRRTAVGECWVLRNSWGEDFGDGGYFRMKDTELTGIQGEHIFITAHAAMPSSQP